LQPLLGKKDQQEVTALLAQKLRNSSANLQLLVFTPAASDACEYCEPLKQLSSELAALSKGKISTKSVTLEESKGLAEKYNIRRAPATVLTVDGSESREPAVKFYGIPSGYEFSALLQDIADVANRHPSALSAETIEKIRKLNSKVHIQVFVTPTCPYCPRAVRTAHQLSIANPEMVDAEMIESMEFPELAEKYSVMAVPKIVINDNVEFEGALPEQIFLSKIEEALSLS
jgi:glutaredoxin-like protein